MSDAPTAHVLRRIAKAAAPPLQAPARALRLALVRAADRAVGLPVSVLHLREEDGMLDDLLSGMEGGVMLLALRCEGAPIGFLALDGEARAAVVERQTLGVLSQSPAEPRPPTSADAALARPLLEAFLNEAQATLEGGPLSDWLCDSDLAERIASTREAAILLPDRRYKAIHLSLDLGAGGRQGLVLILARIPEAATPRTEVATPTVAALVLRAQAEVQAILHRFRLSLGVAEALAVGQVLPLPGVTVASVRLESGGAPLGPARLGQVAGMRAVRIETPLAPDLEPLPSGPGSERIAALPLAGPGWPAAGQGSICSQNDPMGQPGGLPTFLDTAEIEGAWPAMAASP